MKKKEKKAKISIMLIISCLFLVISIGLTCYTFLKNQKSNKELVELKENIKRTKEKINENEEEIKEKENKYEKLKEEVKEKIEELEIWQETKEKLESSLQ